MNASTPFTDTSGPSAEAETTSLPATEPTGYDGEPATDDELAGLFVMHNAHHTSPEVPSSDRKASLAVTKGTKRTRAPDLLPATG